MKITVVSSNPNWHCFHNVNLTKSDMVRKDAWVVKKCRQLLAHKGKDKVKKKKKKVRNTKPESFTKLFLCKSLQKSV